MQLSLDRQLEERDGDQSILQVLSDKYCISILITTRKDPKSVLQISEECKMFLGAVYRRVKLLQKCGFVETFYETKPDGRRFTQYQSNVEGIKAIFDGNQINVSVIQSNS